MSSMHPGIPKENVWNKTVQRHREQKTCVFNLGRKEEDGFKAVNPSRESKQRVKDEDRSAPRGQDIMRDMERTEDQERSLPPGFTHCRRLCRLGRAPAP